MGVWGGKGSNVKKGKKINMVRQTKMFASPLNVVKLAKKLALHFKWTKNNKHPPQITDTDRVD